MGHLKNGLRSALRLFYAEIRPLLGFGSKKLGFRVAKTCFWEVVWKTFFRPRRFFSFFSRKKAGNWAKSDDYDARQLIFAYFGRNCQKWGKFSSPVAGSTLRDYEADNFRIFVWKSRVDTQKSTAIVSVPQFLVLIYHWARDYNNGTSRLWLV